jgi:hypothetical protein
MNAYTGCSIFYTYPNWYFAHSLTIENLYKEATMRKQEIALCSIMVAALFLVSATICSADTLFYDDFEDGNYDGWEKKSGTWKVVDGALEKTGKSGEGKIILKTSEWNSAWKDYNVETRMMLTEGARDAGVMARVRGDNQFYFAEVKVEAFKIMQNNNGWLRPSVAESVPDEGQVKHNEWFHLRFEVDGSKLRHYFNGELVVEATKSTHMEGRIGMRSYEQAMKYDWVLVTTIGSQTTRIKSLSVLPKDAVTKDRGIQFNCKNSNFSSHELPVLLVTPNGRLISQQRTLSDSRMPAAMYLFK